MHSYSTGEVGVQRKTPKLGSSAQRACRPSHLAELDADALAHVPLRGEHVRVTLLDLHQQLLAVRIAPIDFIEPGFLR